MRLAQGERAVGLVAGDLEELGLAVRGVDALRRDLQALVLRRGGRVGGAPVVADHAEHVVLVALVGAERALLGGPLSAGGERGEVHDRADGTAEGIGLRRVVGEAALHRQGAEVGVAEAEGAVEVRALRDLAARELSHQDRDLEHDRPQPAGVPEQDVIEVVAAIERHQVHRGQVAGRVVQEDVLGARVRGDDLAVGRAGVPLVRRVVELDPRVGAEPGRLADLIPQVTGAQDLAGGGRAALGLGLGQLGAVVERPLGVLLHRVHERVGDADRVVRVLAGDGQVRLALPVGVVLVDLEFLDTLLGEVERALDRGVGDAAGAGAADGLGERRVLTGDKAVIALALLRRGEHRVEVAVEHPGAGDKRGDLGLLDNLPADVLLDVRMVEVERDHLGRPARRAAGLDGARGAVADLEEAHQTGRAAAARQALVGAAELGEVGAGTRAVLEDARLADPEVHDAALVDEVVVDGLDEAGVRGRALVGRRRALELAGDRVAVPVALRRSADAVGPVQTGVEPLRGVRRGDLEGQHGGQLVAERERALLVEVAVGEAPVGPAAGEPAEDLTGVVLADEALLLGKGVDHGGIGLMALEPRRHAVFGDRLEGGGDAGLAAVLLGEDVDGDLTPGLGGHDRRLEGDRSVGVHDARRALDERDPVVGILPLCGVAPLDLHLDLLLVPPHRRGVRILEPAHSTGTTKVTPPSDGPHTGVLRRQARAYNPRMDVEEILRTIGIVLAVGLIAIPIAALLRLPSMVVLVVAGIIAGPTLLNLVDVPIDGVGPSLLFTMGVALILFHGGLGVSLRVISRTAVGLLLLAIPGVMITAGIVALAVMPLFGVSWEIALLVGAVLGATDPAILVPLFDRLGLRPRVAQTVIAESAINDPMSAILALTMAGIITAGGLTGSLIAGDSPLIEFLRNIGLGLVIGIVGGVLIAVLLSSRRFGVLRESVGATLLAIVALAYVSSEVAGGSPYLAAFVAGLIVGNKDLIRIDHDHEQERMLEQYTTQTVDIVVLAIFVVLGLNLDVQLLLDNLWAGLAVTAVFIFIARPATVAICLGLDRRAGWTRQEAVFIGWCRETGVVPVAIASMLVAEKVPGAELVATLVTFAVIATLLLQATTAGWLANRLGLLEAKPRLDPEA